ncbi:MHYT domain-containing protein [Dongia sedimenti]|uniref:MHYT domain-containing protein n=1 Tax=Dongia sedimenti TaxID=3064282 RepID=A0ABU0YH52_9PROT|nr:MHYT domain-containing protein [Rhodospirillaceae bacterium R-7]
MLFSYDPMLVVASVLVAIMASFTGLRLAGDLSALPAPARRIRIAEAACALGGGIWSMHFVGMLALRLPVSISYEALNTLSSVLVSILITGLGLSFVHMGERRLWRTAVSGTLIGLGIVTMHYIGMRAIGGNCLVEYGPAGILLSSGIAILSSIAVVQIAYRRRTLLQVSLAAVLLGITISSMHYTAMAFTRFIPVSELVGLAQPMIQDGYLALIVALAAFVVCGLFLLTALPLPAAGWIAAPAGAPIAAAFAAPEPQVASKPAAPKPAAPRAQPDAADKLRLPYEQGGLTFFLEAARITAIQAEGHYTRLYEGQESHFCPWSISKVEETVAGRNFLRTHRSFLVNLEHARAFQRKHDKVFLVVPGPEDNLVPVSRGHVPEVRKALGL